MPAYPKERKERKGKVEGERKGKVEGERKGKGKGREGKEREGKERRVMRVCQRMQSKGKESKGKERKGKEKQRVKAITCMSNDCSWPNHSGMSEAGPFSNTCASNSRYAASVVASSSFIAGISSFRKRLQYSHNAAYRPAQEGGEPPVTLGEGFSSCESKRDRERGGREGREGREGRREK